MGYKALVQIALIILSIVLIFVYIKPTFADIAKVQDDVFQYQNAISKASEFNSLLAELSRKERSYSDKDKLSLNTFLPDTVDAVQVMGDLESLFVDYEVKLTSLSVDTEEATKNVDVYLEGETAKVDALPHKDFALSVVDSYSNIKMILSLIESNAYPLEVVSIDMSQAVSDEEGLAALQGSADRFNCDIVLRVHSMFPSEVSDLSAN